MKRPAPPPIEPQPAPKVRAAESERKKAEARSWLYRLLDAGLKFIQPHAASAILGDSLGRILICRNVRHAIAHHGFTRIRFANQEVALHQAGHLKSSVHFLTGPQKEHSLIASSPVADSCNFLSVSLSRASGLLHHDRRRGLPFQGARYLKSCVSKDQ